MFGVARLAVAVNYGKIVCFILPSPGPAAEEGPPSQGTRTGPLDFFLHASTAKALPPGAPPVANYFYGQILCT